MIRSPGIRQFSKYSSVVGEPLMPSLRSFGPDGEALVVLVHHERRDAVGALVRVGHRHHRVPGRLAAVGDPALGAVEDPVVAVAPGPGAHRRGVAAGLALGQRIRRHRLAGRRSTGSTCFLSSSEPDRIRPIVPSLLTAGISDDDAHDPRHLLDHDARRDRVRALAAVLLGHVHRVEPGRVQRLERLLGEARLLVDVGGVRGDLLLAQIAQHRTQLVVLLGQLEHIETTDYQPSELLATRQ